MYKTKTRILPIVRWESEAFFCKRSHSLLPWTILASIEGHHFLTGFIKNASVLSLLGISQDDGLVNAGLIGETDMVGSEDYDSPSIWAVAFGDESGGVRHVLEFSKAEREKLTFLANEGGNQRRLYLRKSLTTKLLGLSPVTVKVEGYIHVDTGDAQITFDQRLYDIGGEKMQIVGYMLEGYRLS
jgi:hypothetical protein